MANTYSWTINKLDVHPTEDTLTNVVYNVHYTYVGTSDQTDPDGNNYTANIIGTIVVGSPDPDDYIPFEDLEESDVVGWIEPELDLDALQSSLDNTIAEEINPTSVAKDVPW
jgi:hypothetical protein